MSSPERAAKNSEDEEKASSGPNLVLLYSLMALAFLAAMVIAGLIVLPYYQHR